MIFPEKVYEVLAWCNRVVLPALIALLTCVLGCLSVDPTTIAVIDGIISGLNGFLGAILQDSKRVYEKSSEG